MGDFENASKTTASSVAGAAKSGPFNVQPVENLCILVVCQGAATGNSLRWSLRSGQEAFPPSGHFCNGI